MELGIHFANFTLPGGPEALGPTLAGTARAAEEGGCAVFTLMDHWFQMETLATRQDPMLEGYTALGFLAERHGLGCRRVHAGVGRGVCVVRRLWSMNRRQERSGSSASRQKPAASAPVTARPARSGITILEQAGLERAISACPAECRPKVGRRI